MGRIARFIFAGFVVAAAHAQEPPATSSEPNIDKITNDWYTRASTLEQRVTRMLPCDARIRAAIDEVARMSSQRTAAVNAMWQARSAQSAAQIDAIRKLQSSLISESAEWKSDSLDAQQEQAGLAGMSADLGDSAKRNANFNAALKSLTAMGEQSAALAKLASDRETSGMALNQHIGDLLASAQARQTAIEAAQKAAAAEGARWTAYYATRLARAQTECSITGQVSIPAPAKPAPAKR